MITPNRFASIAKTTLFLGAATLMTNACSDKGATASKHATGERTAYETNTDHALGDPKAPVTIVEYSSIACGACANWHATILPDLKSKYIATGKVRYVLRPYPTGNVSLANAGHLLAACAPEDKYFDMIEVQMKRQRQIFTSADKKGEFVALAMSVGMTEAEFDACMSDPAGLERLQAIYAGGENIGVTGTPMFFINGNKEQVFTVEDFEKVILPILGEPIPEASKSETPKTDDKSGAADH